MMTESERRRFTRVQFDTAATLIQGDTLFHTHVVDISLKGVLLETPEDYTMRADCPAVISIFLGDEVELQMKVVLVHSGSRVLGFNCTSIDMESVGHLRRLIELNMDDSNATERVLEELMQEHDL